MGLLFFGYNFVKYLEVYKKVKYPDGHNKVYFFLGGGLKDNSDCIALYRLVVRYVTLNV